MLYKKLALLAKLQNVSQKRIAEGCGLSRISIYRFFSGKTELKVTDFVELLDILGLDVEKQVDARLTAKLNNQAPSKEPVLADASLILKSLRSNVRKALLEQISWWGQSSPDREILTAVGRIKDHLRETPIPLEGA